ncbi:galactosamine-6-phosphate isomerase [Dysgonomonas sp. ZJ709]|uniref:galactosamine-6-phosphate isomerase n=1 Tax=Dysgonomonas sp. ZJ709 TaxID=2709797 RepID=UPI0013EBF8DF|nr:galactosamine-6-phosphate isomerase [Dysgonomonas sp. ZJ709]
MKIELCDSYDQLSRKANDIIIENLLQHKSLLFCAATGNSPTRMYEMLSKEYSNRSELFSQIQVIKLDEWGGLPQNHSGTCETYLQEYVIKPLKITEDRYVSFQSNALQPEKECERVQSELEKRGPIDICILGLGMNGHIAFNEPADFLQPNCHIARLSPQSLQHSMVAGEDNKPQYGLTLGMADIMGSKLIILLINGVNKREITQSFLSTKITTSLPASLLWLHPNVICLLDKEAIGDLK